MVKGLPGAFVVLLLACPLAKAQLVIDGTFGSSITSLSDASTIEAGIDDAISRLEAAVETPITVNIDFEDDTSISLGASETYINDLSYSKYLTDLENLPAHSADQLTALASLPVQTDNPVNGNSKLVLSLPLLRAIGEAALGDNADISGDPDDLDGTIDLNIPAMNVSRSGGQNPDDYDLQSVATHEMDEVLGIGGEGSALNSGTAGPVGVMDLYRYSAPDTRSYTTSPNATAYFSINSGATNLVYFNQSSNGDFGDWGDGVAPADQEPSDPPLVQDAFSEPGVDIDLGTPELTALNVVGYELAAVPEPKNIALLVIGSLVVLIVWRRLVGSI
ncbi:MAG TPA: NF038122 family metalloprotease [Chthoniobacteraceae bacterium]|jgi:hypothetical protein|nr:NF038122 family metalloprotease [Chthoniobacteraceae bacterium]